MIAQTPEAPYYAVIFTSIKSADLAGYDDVANRMVELAEQQDGFLGIESAQDDLGITVSYWKDEESIRNWYGQIEHRAAQEEGKKRWYDAYSVRVSKVERVYGFER